MTSPPEWDEAVLLYKLCQAYQSLPSVGGVLDQDVGLLRMHAILAAGGYFEAEGQTTSAPAAVREPEPMDGIAMIPLGVA